jgi:hypothetical protein
MTVRKMVEQVAEGENAQLFLQEVGLKRTYTFQVFNGL